MTSEPKTIFIMPESGYGEFQDYFEARYNEVVGKVPEMGPSHVDNACEIADEATEAYIKSLGYEIVYPDYEEETKTE